MTEFSTRAERLSARLRRGTTQCDLVEQRACLAEQRLSTLNESVQQLARLIEVSLLVLGSSDREKCSWLRLINTDNSPSSRGTRDRFFRRLETHLHRSIVDVDEQGAYLTALTAVSKPSLVSSNVFL